MRYLGGKSKGKLPIAIAAIVNQERAGRPFWDPFCGGLGVARRLAEAGPGIVSDTNHALISLYQAVRAGWDPPVALSREEWTAARTLPDSDPRKAFAGFGCSFGGTWFGSYIPDAEVWNVRDQKHDKQRPAYATRNGLIKDRAWLEGCAVERLDFLAIEPRLLACVIYADPPYAGTAGYKGIGAFDHALFWSRVQGWERAGVPVFVSEYACPVPHRVCLEQDKPVHLAATGAAQGGIKRATERLFRVLV